MDKRYGIRACSAPVATLLLLAATAVAQPSPGNGEERRSRQLDPIYLRLGERRLVDRRLVERIRCQDGVLTVRPFGRTVLVQCVLHLQFVTVRR